MTKHVTVRWQGELDFDCTDEAGASVSMSPTPSAYSPSELLLAALQTNALSTVALLTQLAGMLEQQRGGTLAVISSVAGDRGRQSNYVYGSAKAMVDAFASGLRNRLQRHGVRVCTIKPGFVDTPMTAGFSKGLLWAQPEQVARGIVKAMDRGQPVSYQPFFWRYIMLAIKHIPERVFMRLSL